MSLIQGSSATDPRYANYQPGRTLTASEIALRSSLGAVPASSATNYNVANYQAAPTNTPAPSQPAPSGVGTDFNATKAAMLAGQIPQDDNLLARLSQNAQSGLDSTMSAIQNKLNLVRDQANQQISNATGTRDYIMDFINKRYPELQRRVEEQQGNLLGDLGTQKTDLTNLYDRANAQARRRAESAALQNRNAARAGNRLGSSFYDETVAQNQESLGSTLGASDLERIGKLAGIGTQETRVKQDTANTLNDLDTQKNQAAYQAIDEYNKSVQQAEYLSRAGLADFGTEQAQAEQNLQSRLDAIAQWAQGLAVQKMALDAQYGSNGADGSVGSSLATLTGNTNDFLTKNASTPLGTNALNYSSKILGTPQQISTSNPYANQGVSTTDDILKRLGLA